MSDVIEQPQDLDREDYFLKQRYHFEYATTTEKDDGVARACFNRDSIQTWV
jgi:hypothetical protein